MCSALALLAHRTEKDREKISLLIDFSKYSNLTGLSMIRMSLDVLKILSDHYPERLGSAWMVHASWSFTFFWKSISPFLDHVTKKKIFFINKLQELRDWIDEDVLEVEYSGKNDAEYSYEEYKAREAALFPPYHEDGDLVHPPGSSHAHDAQESKKKKKSKKKRQQHDEEHGEAATEEAESSETPAGLHAASSTSEVEASSSTKSKKKKMKKRSSASAPIESSHEHSEESRESANADHFHKDSKHSKHHEKRSSASVDTSDLDHSADSEKEAPDTQKKVKKSKKKIAEEEHEA